MVDSSSGDELGDEGGSFRGLFDSIEVHRHRVGAPSNSIVHGIRWKVSDLCLSSLLSAPPASPVGGAVEGGPNVGGVDGPVIGGCLASVVGREEHGSDDCLDSVAGGVTILGLHEAVAVLGVGGASDLVADSHPSVVVGDASGCVSSSVIGGNPLCRGPTGLPSLQVSASVPVVSVQDDRARREVLDSSQLSGPTHAGGGSHRPAVAIARPVRGKGIAGLSRFYAVVTVSDMKSDVKLSFVQPVNSNGKKHVILCDSD
ncbi:hypothetical protein Dimus_010661 [Dionaea muscipula]